MMKRLLAYLFLVLGLGFFINSHALALTKGMCIINSGSQNNFILRPNNKTRECQKSQLISEKEYPARYKQMKKIFKEAELEFKNKTGIIWKVFSNRGIVLYDINY